MAKPKHVLANSETVPEVLDLLGDCLKRHEKALRDLDISQDGAERKLIVLRAKYDGMLQLIKDFTRVVQQAK